MAGSKLFFAKDRWSAPHGMIDLGLATGVESTDVKEHAFQIVAKDATYLIRADCEKEKDDWIKNLEKQIIRRNEGETNLIENDIANGGTVPQCNDNAKGEDKVNEDDDELYKNAAMHPLLMLEALYSGSTP